MDTIFPKGRGEEKEADPTSEISAHFALQVRRVGSDLADPVTH